VFYVCSATPLQRALAQVLMSNPNYYEELRQRFTGKRAVAAEALNQLGFEIYDSSSAFYLWTRIPKGYADAMELNEKLIAAGVAGVPGAAFGSGELCDHYMRFCIARENEILQNALTKLQRALAR
jgi:aspartate/methionine/tyrosine aminotransferase